MKTNTISLDRSLTLVRLSAYLLLFFVAIWFLAVFPAIDKPASLLIDFLDWPVDSSHNVLSHETRFLSGIGSGLLTAMALYMLLVVIPELEAGNFRVLKGAAIATLGWYIVDSIGSCASGAPSNAVFNTGFLIMLLSPLWLVARAQKQFSSHQASATGVSNPQSGTSHH